MPLPVIRKGAAAVAPLTVVPDPDSHVRRIPVRVPVPDPVKGYEWWLAFDAQLHRQVMAAWLAPRALPDGEERLAIFTAGAHHVLWVTAYPGVRAWISNTL